MGFKGMMRNVCIQCCKFWAFPVSFLLELSPEYYSPLVVCIDLLISCSEVFHPVCIIIIQTTESIPLSFLSGIYFPIKVP